jgi:mono/diheme cytochrome c family protein
MRRERTSPAPRRPCARFAKRTIGGAILLCAWAAAATSDADRDGRGRFIEVWVRGARSSEQDSPRHLKSRRFDLDRVAKTEVDLYDAQYDRVARYRGLALRALLDDVRPEANVDLAILHFANGMAVPIPFRDRAAMVRLDPFIAREYRPNATSPRSTAFPSISKAGSDEDPRPITFSGNKVIVRDRWHPDVTPTTAPLFSPWTKVDTLIDVELVVGASYYAQFDVGDEPTVRKGFALYRANCQFCHGARSVGARFGWDFVDAPTIYDASQSAAALYHSVAYRPRNATVLGLLMPALASLTEEDAGSLQDWLRAIATRPMPPYAPPPRSPRPAR